MRINRAPEDRGDTKKPKGTQGRKGEPSGSKPSTSYKAALTGIKIAVILKGYPDAMMTEEQSRENTDHVMTCIDTAQGKAPRNSAI